MPTQKEMVLCNIEEVKAEKRKVVVKKKAENKAKNKVGQE